MTKNDLNVGALKLKNNAEIISTFNNFTTHDIEYILKNHGGLLCDNYEMDTTKTHRETIVTRSDSWQLEAQYNTYTCKVEAWIKGTSRPTGNTEAKCLRQWYIRLGFDELETMIYHMSNITNKKRIAPEVGALVLYRKGLCATTLHSPTFSPYAVTAADRLQELIFEFITAARASKRIS